MWKSVEGSGPKKMSLNFSCAQLTAATTLETFLTTAMSGAKYLQTSFQITGKKPEGQSASSMMNEAHVTQRK